MDAIRILIMEVLQFYFWLQSFKVVGVGNK